MKIQSTINFFHTNIAASGPRFGYLSRIDRFKLNRQSEKYDKTIQEQTWISSAMTKDIETLALNICNYHTKSKNRYDYYVSERNNFRAGQKIYEKVLIEKLKNGANLSQASLERIARTFRDHDTYKPPRKLQKALNVALKRYDMKLSSASKPISTDKIFESAIKNHYLDSWKNQPTEKISEELRYLLDQQKKMSGLRNFLQRKTLKREESQEIRQRIDHLRALLLVKAQAENV